MASSTEWTSIPVHPDVRDAIREQKPNSASYTEYLQDLLDTQVSDGGTTG